MCEAVGYKSYHYNHDQRKKDMDIQKTSDAGRSRSLVFFRIIFFIFFWKIVILVCLWRNIGSLLFIWLMCGFTRICVLHSFVFQVYNLNIRHAIHRWCVDIMVAIISFHELNLSISSICHCGQNKLFWFYYYTERKSIILEKFKKFWRNGRMPWCGENTML